MQKYAKLPVSFQCNERDSVTNFIYHSESYNAIYVNLVSIENSQIRVCSAGVSDTVSIGFLFIANTGVKFATGGVNVTGGKPAEKFAADFNVTNGRQ